MVLAFMTLYIKSIGFSTRQGGIVVAIYGIGSVAGAYLGGKITDKFGFYYTQFTALFAGGIMFLLLGQMQRYEAICICTFFLSLVNESFRPANAAAIAHYSTVKNRTQSFSLVRLAINVGWGIGVAIGGLLASFNYHLLFWADGLTSISAAFMLLAILPRVTLHQQSQPSHKQQENDIRSTPYHDREFLKFLLLTFLFATCFFQLFTTIPLFFKEGLHLDEFRIGAVMSVNGILIAAVEMVLVFKLEGRRPYLVLMSAGSLFMGIAFLLLNLPLSSGLAVAVISMLVITVAEMTGMPFMNSYYIGRSNERNRGQYAGLYTMSWSLAQVIGSGCGALLAASIGFLNLWFIIGFICMLTAYGYFALYKST